ncbi:MAG: PilZ domain-containing protein [Nitrospiraceae bacterium]|nr:MAG: PilZ domain-containing protein [Nitrospiraceae bacterium]
MDTMCIQRRAFERIPVNIKVRFYCYDTDYLGTVTNLSENGMFISMNKMLFPFDSRIDIIIPLSDKLLRVPVLVIRMTRSEQIFDGMGVEVLNSSPDYLAFVSSLK